MIQSSVAATVTPYSVYEAMNDIQLVQLAQQGDNQAFTVLFEKYKPALEKKANIDRAEYPSVAFQTFYDHNVQLFYAAVRKMDTDIGTFKGWLKKKLSTAKYEVLRKKYYRNMYDDDGNRVKKTDCFISLETGWDKGSETVANNNREEFQNRIPDETAYVDYVTDESETELYEFIASKSEKDAKALYMKTQGYTNDQIGEVCGVEGNRCKKAMWTTRAIERCQKYTVEFYKLNKLNLSLKED